MQVVWLAQAFATRFENVAPFLISFWQGTMELTPATDTWVDQSRLEAKIINTEGNYAETFNNMVSAGQIGPNTGFGPIVWDSGNKLDWYDILNNTRNRTETQGGEWRGILWEIEEELHLVIE